eukprot:g36961.t1
MIEAVAAPRDTFGSLRIRLHQQIAQCDQLLSSGPRYVSLHVLDSRRWDAAKLRSLGVKVTEQPVTCDTPLAIVTVHCDRGENATELIRTLITNNIFQTGNVESLSFKFVEARKENGFEGNPGPVVCLLFFARMSPVSLKYLWTQLANHSQRLADQYLGLSDLAAAHFLQYFIPEDGILIEFPTALSSHPGDKSHIAEASKTLMMMSVEKAMPTAQTKERGTTCEIDQVFSGACPTSTRAVCSAPLTATFPLSASTAAMVEPRDMFKPLNWTPREEELEADQTACLSPIVCVCCDTLFLSSDSMLCPRCKKVRGRAGAPMEAEAASSSSSWCTIS